MDLQHRAIIATSCGIALFGAASALNGDYNPWLTNLLAALLVLGAVMIGAPPRADRLWRASAGQVGVAIAIGVAMVAATHGAYAAAIELWPALDHRVERLYLDIREDSPGFVVTVPLTIAVVAAEELLWRGVAVELLRPRMTAVKTGAAAVALYAVPQLIGGEWVLVAAAVVAGIIFTAQRLITGSLVVPTISHAVWSVSIFVLLPLR